jgi:hypothetical protein
MTVITKRRSGTIRSCIRNDNSSNETSIIKGTTTINRCILKVTVTFIASSFGCYFLLSFLSINNNNNILNSTLTTMKSSNHSTSISTSTSTRSMSSRILNIQYDLVEEDVGKHKRFAAFDVTNQNDPKPIPIKQWMQCISANNDDDSLRFIQEITEFINQNTEQYKAYFFETKGVSMMNVSQKQFEFVLVNSIHLSNFCESNGPSSETFGKYLNCLPRSNDTCCAFPNIGHTATLISPKNLGDYSHIGKFMRNAPLEEINQLWKKICHEFFFVLSVNPTKSFWLSTSGLGVSWLHFRIDKVPKYYTYHAFAKET